MQTKQVVAANWVSKTAVKQIVLQKKECRQLFHTLMLGNALVLALLKDEFTITRITNAVSSQHKLVKDAGLGAIPELAKWIGNV